MIKTVRNLIGLCVLTVSLAGCAYFEPAPLPSGDPVASVETSERLTPDLPPVQAPKMAQADIARAVALSTKGRVQLFSLDSDMPDTRGSGSRVSSALAVSPVEALPPYGAESKELAFSSPFQSHKSKNGSVEIFSLDGGARFPDSGRRSVVAGPSGLRPRDLLYFAHDSTALDAESLALIDALAGMLGRSGRPVRIEGHASLQAHQKTDSARRIVNLKVSMDRAFAVSRALIARGVPAASLRVSAWGDVAPPQDGTGQPDDSHARRVEIFY